MAVGKTKQTRRSMGLMARSRAARKLSLPKPRKPTLLFSLVGLGCVALLVARVTSCCEPPLSVDLCQPDLPVTRHVLVCADTTDVLSPAEAHKMRAIIRRLKDSLQVGERLSLWVMAPDGNGPVAREVFSRCRPPDGRHANPLFENWSRLKQRFQEEFEKPLEDAIAAITAWKNADTSPIVMSLYEIASWHLFLPAAAKQRELYIISDLLEHSEVLNQYAQTYHWSSVQKSPWITAVENRLSGVNVEVYLRTNTRTSAFHHKLHQQFWRSYMNHAGAHYRVEPF